MAEVKTLDRLGKCPACDKDLNGGDLLDQIKKLDVFTHTAPSDIMRVAASMGYSEENKTKFTKLTVYEIDGEIVLECPGCKHVFSAGGEDMGIMMDYRQNRRLVK